MEPRAPRRSARPPLCRLGTSAGRLAAAGAIHGRV
nr:MAG TPA: hypothetical protein [Caudoviricetes sp.]